MGKIFVRDAVKEDLEKIVVQKEQADEIKNTEFMDGMYSFVDEQNKIYAVFWLVRYWKGRAAVKAFFAADAGKKLLQIIRILKMLYDKNAKDYERLEAEIVKGFRNGKRFAELFGFYEESVMTKYYFGKDYWMYVKINNP